MRVLMWEVRARDAEAVEALLAWWREVAHGMNKRVDLYRAADDRVVAIVHGAEPGDRLPEPPDRLAARPPHAWPFEAVETIGAVED